ITTSHIRSFRYRTRGPRLDSKASLTSDYHKVFAAEKICCLVRFFDEQSKHSPSYEKFRVASAGRLIRDIGRDGGSYLCPTDHGWLDRIGQVFIFVTNETQVDDRQCSCGCFPGNAVIKDRESDRGHSTFPLIRKATFINGANRCRKSQTLQFVE